MGTLSVDDLVAQIGTDLHDSANIRWTVPQLIGYLNAGARVLVSLKPEANSVRDKVKLVVGTEQTIPAGGLQFLRLLYNFGTSGDKVGPAITMADADAMDRDSPGWRTDAASAEVVHFLFREQDPQHFDVWPPQPGTNQGYVQMLYSKLPGAMVSGGVLTIPDHYHEVLYHYAMYRAYSRNNAIASNNARAIEQRQTFMGLLGLKDRVEAIHDPAVRERTRAQGATIQ